MSDEDDPFASPIKPAKAASRPLRSKPVLVRCHVGDDPFELDDPFAVPAGPILPQPRVPDDRRCVIGDPFGPSMSLPVTLIERCWDGRSRVVSFDIRDGALVHMVGTASRSTEAEAESEALKHGGCLLVGIQSDETASLIEVTIRATTDAMLRGQR